MQRDQVVFFVDRCLGAHIVPDALRAKGDVIAAAFVAALEKMRRICLAYARPVIATVSASGVVVVLEGFRRGGVRRES